MWSKVNTLYPTRYRIFHQILFSSYTFCSTRYLILHQIPNPPSNTLHSTRYLILRQIPYAHRILYASPHTLFSTNSFILHQISYASPYTLYSTETLYSTINLIIIYTPPNLCLILHQITYTPPSSPLRDLKSSVDILSPRFFVHPSWFFPFDEDTYV